MSPAIRVLFPSPLHPQPATSILALREQAEAVKCDGHGALRTPVNPQRPSVLTAKIGKPPARRNFSR
ncbi:hypothetical protein FS749_012068 [Ceratobasidium sp. UAMH 11750]|nr:hypothetical protein FS749_012068 [Ceratobasidium sp. UAMH 11750]